MVGVAIEFVLRFEGVSCLVAATGGKPLQGARQLFSARVRRDPQFGFPSETQEPSFFKILYRLQSECGKDSS